MPPRQHNSLIAKRVKARIAIRQARDASPAEIAQYALYAAQQWRLRAGLVSFLTAPERQAFERLEQYHHERSAAPTAAFPLPFLEVRPAEQRLRELNTWYRNNVAALDIKTEVFYEKKKRSGILVVNATSADPGISGVIPIPVDSDHAHICKPSSKNQLTYVKVKKFVEACFRVQ